MFEVELDKNRGVAIVRPDGSLTRSDFEAVGAQIDPYIQQHGRLGGLVIAADKFAGWHDFGALFSHLTFVNDHHRRIDKVAE